MKFATGVMIVALSVVALAPVSAADNRAEHDPSAQGFVHGAPKDPTAAWTLAAGGRIYDTWWEALDRKKPQETNPAYPARAKRSGATTWRCVECHGWDYKGKDGINGKDQPLSDRFTGISGVRGAQSLQADAIVKMMRSPSHGYTPEMIPDEEMVRLAEFLRSGQHDTDIFIDRTTRKVRGDKQRGAAVYQTICAACHGLDGRALNWGTPQKPGYIGTEANELPWEVMHKMRNAHPGAAMVNLRALPLQDSIDTLAYTQTLPEK
ncbi:MAG: cytochrome c [Hyphomicrobiaceae bacterium]